MRKVSNNSINTINNRFSLGVEEMSELTTRDGTAKPVSRDQARTGTTCRTEHHNRLMPNLLKVMHINFSLPCMLMASPTLGSTNIANSSTQKV